MRGRKSKLQHRLFQAGVVLKGLDGLLELAVAILLFSFGPSGISRAAAWVTRLASSDTTRSWLEDHLVRHTHAIGATSVKFAGIYLLGQGVIKLGLVIGLLRERRWIFPVALVIMGLLVGYMMVREVQQPSLGLHVLLALNIIITLLIWREYNDLKSSRSFT